jgi:hypothetical protein
MFATPEMAARGRIILTIGFDFAATNQAKCGADCISGTVILSRKSISDCGSVAVKDRGEGGPALTSRSSMDQVGHGLVWLEWNDSDITGMIIKTIELTIPPQ